MKEAIYTDNDRVERLWEKCQEAVLAMQKIIDALASTECEFSAEEVWKLVNGKIEASQVAEAVMDKKLKAETPRIFGIKLSRTKLLEMVEIDNMGEILAVLEDAKMGRNGESYRNVQRYIKVKDGAAYIVDTAQKDIAESCTLYATTKEQLTKAEAINATARALNKLQGYGIVSSDKFIAPEVSGLIKRGNLDGWGYAPDMHVLRQIIEN